MKATDVGRDEKKNNKTDRQTKGHREKLIDTQSVIQLDRQLSRRDKLHNAQTESQGRH